MANLSRALIARTTLEILDAEGIAGFSMRHVARALAVSPMALYHHVENKRALANLVIDASLAEFPLPEYAEDWQDNLWSIAAWSRRCWLAHPALLELRRRYDIWTSESHLLANNWMVSWQQSGLDAERAVLAAITTSAAVTGLVSDEMNNPQRQYRPNNPDLPDMPGADLLLTAGGDAEQIFELGVRSIVEGLHARLMREQLAAGA